MDFSIIIVAGLTMVGSLVGTYFSNNKTTALISYRIQQLEEKVNAHNHVVERTVILERDMKTAWREIDEIKDHMKDGEK